MIPKFFLTFLGAVSAYFLHAELCMGNPSGDCVAVFFYGANQRECSPMQRNVGKVVESGWAIRFVDVKREPEIAIRRHVENLPTLVLLRNGREVDRIVGVIHEAEIRRRMESASSPESLHRSSTTESSNEWTLRGQSPTGLIPLAGALVTAPAIAPPTKQSQVRLDTRPSHPAEATVRIRVDEPQHEAIGTGTIIDSHDGEALVLTCGHLFRDTQGRAPIVVETFFHGSPRTYQATMIDFQADETDIGLISFRTEGPVPVARLIHHAVKLSEGEEVFSWGCDRGAPPSRRDSRITKLNRYLGSPNVEVQGAPVQGRSGGGLFNRAGELIGVCYAADNELDEGLYNAPQVVYQQLTRLGLHRLFTEVVESNTTPTPRSPKLTVVLEENGAKSQWQIDEPSPQLLQAIRAPSTVR